MAYSKTTWKDNQAPYLNSSNLNNIESGIYENSIVSRENETNIATNTQNISENRTDIDINTSNIASLSTGETYKGEWTPTAGTEYPSGSVQGDTYYVTGLSDSGYEFTTGDLVGRTANNNDKMIFNGTNWSMINNASCKDYFFIVDDVASMLASQPVDGSRCETQGYYNRDDGGGGSFNYDASLSTTNNGGTIINGWVRQYSGAISVMWFGAVGNGITDDTDAINSAITYAKSLLDPQARSELDNGVAIRLGRNHLCLSPINLTDIRPAMNFIVFGNGATIYSRAAGKQAIDMLGSKSITLKDFSIWADSADGLEFGITMGRRVTGEVAAGNSFYDVVIQGYYNQASLYNIASEQSTFNSCTFFNDYDSGAGAYVMINDSYNSFGVTSDYIDLSGLIVNDNNSFNANQYYGCSFYRRPFDGNDSSSTAIYMDQNCQKHVYIGCYAVASGVRAITIKFRDIGGVVTGGWTDLNGLYMDLHVEKYSDSSGLSYALDISAENITDDVVVHDFKYLDNNPHVSTAIIRVTDSNSMTFYNSEISIIQTSTGTPKVFQPANMTNYFGRISIPATVAVTFQGTVVGDVIVDYRGATHSELVSLVNDMSPNVSITSYDEDNTKAVFHMAYPKDTELATVNTGGTYHDTVSNTLKIKG